MLPATAEWDHYGVVVRSTLVYSSAFLGARWPIHPERAHDNTVAAIRQRIGVIVDKALLMDNVTTGVAVSAPVLTADRVSVDVNITSYNLMTSQLLRVLSDLTAGGIMLASLQAMSPDIFNSVTDLAFKPGAMPTYEPVQHT